jgi:ribosomal protein S18 acetylase RimI-like enzyme
MIFYKENFDSDVFQTNVYRIIFPSNLDDMELFNKKVSEKNSIYYCFTPFSLSNISLLEKSSFNLMSIRTTYKLKNLPYASKETHIEDYVIKEYIQKNELEISDERIIELSNTIGKTSRYFADKKLTKKKALSLYIQWIKNSIYNNYADKIFFVLFKNTLIGIITLKIKENNGYIDLIGILPDHQRKGLGEVLLRKGVEWLKNAQCSDILVVTEGENINANKFYQKNGFIIDDIELVYHKHT